MEAEDQPQTVSNIAVFDAEKQRSVPFDGRFFKPNVLVDAPNPEMPLLDAIHTRRSSRSYSTKPVDRATFDWLVSNAMHAPTACNEQQWKIIHIDDPGMIEELYWRGSAAFLRNTRQCFLVCYNRRTDNRHWHDHIQSGAAFITTFQLLAHSIGIGSCWIGHLPSKGEVSRLFGIHRAYEPVALVSYGYYRGKIKVQPRKHEATRIVMDNQFQTEGLQFDSATKYIFRTVARWMYYRIPPMLRRRIRSLTFPYEKKFYYETFD